MPAKQPPLFPPTAALLADVGTRLKLARLRRRLSAATVAARAGISRATLGRAERGDGAVTLATYARILKVLGLESDLAMVARDDELGRRLQDLDLPVRRRARAPRAATGEHP